MRALLILIAASQLQGCENGRADADPAARTPPTEQQLLFGTLYRNSSATLYWWPSPREAPVAIQHAVDRAGDILAGLPQTEVGAFSVSYESNDLPQISLWIRRLGNQELLVYNHGHSGLPLATESYVVRFLRLALESGKDVLLTSMPLTGLNAPVPGTQYRIRTRDSTELTSVDPTVLTTFSSMHALYEIVDDRASYMHYFIDGAVVPLAFLDRRSLPADSATVAEAGNELPPPPAYLAVNYVGLSGGATTGLTTCAALSLRRCVLVAGVMPFDLRVKYFKNFGDAEQQSRSIYQNFGVGRLLRVAATNTDTLVLLFNQNDSCCFADPAATEFQQRHPEYDIRVLPLDYHGYEPETILGILSN